MHSSSLLNVSTYFILFDGYEFKQVLLIEYYFLRYFIVNRITDLTKTDVPE